MRFTFFVYRFSPFFNTNRLFIIQYDVFRYTLSVFFIKNRSFGLVNLIFSYTNVAYGKTMALFE